MLGFSRFADYMWNGPRFDNGRYLRQNFRADTTRLKTSTYCYNGLITGTSEDEEKLVREIDGTLEVTTPNTKTREVAQAKYDAMGSKTFWTGFCSGVGCAYCIVDLTFIGGMNTTAAIVGAVFAAAFSGFSFYRSSQAYTERAKWDDPIHGFCAMRAKYHSDFRRLKDNNYKNFYFTKDETRDILFRTMNTALSEFDRSQTSGNPEGFIRNFLQNTNPILPDSIEYAFGDQQEIFNPKAPIDGYWIKSEIMTIAYKILELSGDLQDFDDELDDQLQANRRWYEMGRFATLGGSMVLDDALYQNKEAALEPHRQQKRERIAALNQSLNSGTITQAEYENGRRSINSNFHHNPAVQKINDRYWNNHGTAYVGKTILHGALSLAEIHSADKIKRKGRKEMLARFREPTFDCFKHYRDSKKFSSHLFQK